MVFTTRIFNTDNFTIKLDLSEQKLCIDCDEGPWGGIYATYDEQTGQWIDSERTISPKITKLRSFGYKPMAYLGQKAKCFDDSLLAALELYEQPKKANLLLEVASVLKSAKIQPSDRGLVSFLSACLEGKLDVLIPRSAEQAITEYRKEFSANAGLSLPIGFYSWNDSLSAIYRQDRLLQQQLKDERSIQILESALSEVKNGRATYENWLSFVQTVTSVFRSNYSPLLSESLQSSSENRVCFIPPSRSPDGEIITELYGNSPIPDSFCLISELMRRISTRELDLTPTAKSGWYDYCLWAHEPLLLPDRAKEAERFTVSENYKKQLCELFKGFTALARETHIKNAPPLYGTGWFTEELVAGPGLSTEPLVTYYLRRAIGYQFILKRLTQIMGKDLQTLHGVTPDGFRKPILEQELQDVSELFFGAFLTSCSELGIPPVIYKDCPPEDQWSSCQQRFKEWDPIADVDVNRDTRMMVPVFYDLARQKYKVWMHLGWESKELKITYANHPSVEVHRRDGTPVKLKVVHSREEQWNLRRSHNKEDYDEVFTFLEEGGGFTFVPYFAETYVTELLPRDEFRALCDKFKSPEAIVRELK